jgi:hypothetical protein
MSKAKFASKAEASKAKWFSRRHETSQPHFDAKHKYEEEQTAKFQAAQVRTEQAEARRAKVLFL